MYLFYDITNTVSHKFITGTASFLLLEKLNNQMSTCFLFSPMKARDENSPLKNLSKIASPMIGGI